MVRIPLFIAGAAAWLYFFSGFNLARPPYDWAKESAYLDVLRQGLKQGKIPWRWNIHTIHRTDQVMAIPEVCLTPDILLLPWLSNETFVVIHLLLWYALGCWGLHRLLPDAPLLIFFFAFTLFNFNGYITAHLAVGHFQWTGYFALPLLLEWSRHLQRQALPLALLVGGLFLNGSFHIALWALLFLFMVGTTQANRGDFVAVALACGLGALMGLNRLLPALVVLDGPLPTHTGYPSLALLADSLTRLHPHQTHYGPLGWWEYDIYIGYVGLFVLLVGTVRGFRFTPTLMPATFFGLWSMSGVYEFVFSLPTSWAQIERVPSRFMIIPLVVGLGVLMPRGLQRYYDQAPDRARAIGLTLTPFLTWELYSHMALWRPQALQAAGRMALPSVQIAADAPTYAAWLWSGWILSGAVCTMVAWRLHSNLKRRHSP